jgi:hypothetical protein
MKNEHESDHGPSWSQKLGPLDVNDSLYQQLKKSRVVGDDVQGATKGVFITNSIVSEMLDNARYHFIALIKEFRRSDWTSWSCRLPLRIPWHQCAHPEPLRRISLIPALHNQNLPDSKIWLDSRIVALKSVVHLTRKQKRRCLKVEGARLDPCCDWELRQAPGRLRSLIALENTKTGALTA